MRRRRRLRAPFANGRGRVYAALLFSSSLVPLLAPTPDRAAPGRAAGRLASSPCSAPLRMHLPASGLAPCMHQHARFRPFVRRLPYAHQFFDTVPCCCSLYARTPFSLPPPYVFLIFFSHSYWSLASHEGNSNKCRGDFSKKHSVHTYMPACRWCTR